MKLPRDGVKGEGTSWFLPAGTVAVLLSACYTFRHTACTKIVARVKDPVSTCPLEEAKVPVAGKYGDNA